ncbi:MAG: 30S ribosomal protein S6e [Candidatus Methanospirareceae archaeon]
MQAVVSDPKTGKAYKIEIKDEFGLVGKCIGDVIDGALIGLRGYKLEITGGSDKDGVPMRKEIPGAGRKRVLLSSPPCFRPKEKGQRRRKLVRGREISTEISQVNMKIKEWGDKPIEELVERGEK